MATDLYNDRSLDGIIKYDNNYYSYGDFFSSFHHSLISPFPFSLRVPNPKSLRASLTSTFVQSRAAQSATPKTWYNNQKPLPSSGNLYQLSIFNTYSTHLIPLHDHEILAITHNDNNVKLSGTHSFVGKEYNISYSDYGIRYLGYDPSRDISGIQLKAQDVLTERPTQFSNTYYQEDIFHNNSLPQVITVAAPGTIGYYMIKQRLVLFSENTLRFSAPGAGLNVMTNLSDFTGPDSKTFTITNGSLRAIGELKGLVVLGCADKVMVLDIDATDPVLKTISNIGVANVRPIEFGARLFFVGVDNQSIVQVGLSALYSADDGGLSSLEASLLNPAQSITYSNGLIEKLGTIKIQEVILLLALTDTGNIITMEGGSGSASLWHFGGFVHDFTVLSETDQDDLLYICVERNGKSNIEVMSLVNKVKKEASFYEDFGYPYAQRSDLTDFKDYRRIFYSIENYADCMVRRKFDLRDARLTFDGVETITSNVDFFRSEDKNNAAIQFHKTEYKIAQVLDAKTVKVIYGNASNANTPFVAIQKEYFFKKNSFGMHIHLNGDYFSLVIDGEKFLIVQNSHDYTLELGDDLYGEYMLLGLPYRMLLQTNPLISPETDIPSKPRQAGNIMVLTEFTPSLNGGDKFGVVPNSRSSSPTPKLLVTEHSFAKTSPEEKILNEIMWRSIPASGMSGNVSRIMLESSIPCRVKIIQITYATDV